jgi:hypothetical protein
MLMGLFKGVFYFAIALGFVLLILRSCVAIVGAQEVDVRINEWNRQLMSPGWPTKSNGSETLAHYGYVYNSHNSHDLVKTPQDFSDFMRGQCESTNSFWLGEAEKAKDGAHREEALGWVRECYQLYPPAYE